MPLFLRRLGAFSLAALLLATLPACDSGGGDDDDDVGTTDFIYAGVNFDRLFADPTAAEVDAVRAEWATRTPDAADVSVAFTGTFDGATYHVVTHSVDEGPGAPVTHYGLVRVPEGATNAPVLVVHHGGDDGVGAATSARDQTANTSVQAMADAFPDLFAQTVQVVPTYRSEDLRLEGSGLTCGDGSTTCTSTGTPSPWDYDVDDAMALLSAVLDLDALEGVVDGGRVAALGYSRGANTAMLHAIRDGRVEAATDYYGPTDFFNPVITASTANGDPANGLAFGVLSGNSGALSLPGAQYIFDEVLDPLRGPNNSYDPNADYASARLEVVRRSASLFAADLPPFQVHHHRLDAVVPVGFSQAFQARAGGTGEFNYYGPEAGEPSDAFHAPELTPDMQASLQPTQTFLLGVLGTPTAQPALVWAD